MSKRRIPSSQRHSGKSVDGIKSSSVVDRFIGLSLSGGKSDKACLAVLEYFSDKNRIFLSSLHEKIKSQDTISADLQLVALLQAYGKEINSVVFDVPLSMPKCMRCRLSCPGYEVCNEKEIVYLREIFSKLNIKRKPKKIFTPYTERCADAYLNYKLEERFEVQHTLGSNMAPMAARAHFLSRRIQARLIETNVKIAVYRIGEQLKISKMHTRFHKHSVTGEDSRQLILQQLIEKKNIFIYQQDLKCMIENNHAFDAFICAYVGFLENRSEVEPRPKGFPDDELWPSLPQKI